MKRIACHIIALAFVASFAGGEESSPASAAESKGDLWITIQLNEPGAKKDDKATQATARLPLETAKIVIAAVPAKFRQEAKDEGFDLAVLHKKTEELKEGKTFTQESPPYKLVVGKERRETTDTPASYIRIKVEDMALDLRMPLAAAPFVVKLLTSVFKDLEGLDEPLLRVVEQIQKLPPTDLVRATDGYSVFEIELQ